MVCFKAQSKVEAAVLYFSYFCSYLCPHFTFSLFPLSVLVCKMQFLEEQPKTVKDKYVSEKSWQLVCVSKPGACVGCIDDRLRRVTGPAGMCPFRLELDWWFILWQSSRAQVDIKVKGSIIISQFLTFCVYVCAVWSFHNTMLNADSLCCICGAATPAVSFRVELASSPDAKLQARHNNSQPKSVWLRGTLSRQTKHLSQCGVTSEVLIDLWPADISVTGQIEAPYEL